MGSSVSFRSRGIGKPMLISTVNIFLDVLGEIQASQDDPDQAEYVLLSQ